jgi:hypothetical protein
MSVSMANQRGTGRTGNGRAIERIGLDVARRAAEHADTTLDQIYAGSLDAAAWPAEAAA